MPSLLNVLLAKLLQECQKQEDSLIPLEQAARQKVAEMKTTRDSEKNQSTALKAILQAKESNEIQGIYGRLGDLGAIDGKLYSLCQQNKICPMMCVA